MPRTGAHVRDLNRRVYSCAVPRNLKRYYGRGDLHFVTFSCYRRLRLPASSERRDLFLAALESVRIRYEMVVVGYVVMPEHVHLLLGEPRKENLSVALKALKQSVSRRVLRQLRQCRIPTRARTCGARRQAQPSALLEKLHFHHGLLDHFYGWCIELGQSRTIPAGDTRE